MSLAKLSQLILILNLSFIQTVKATSNGPSPSSKSKLNTQIYESEKEEESFTAVVKAVREVQGETEVFFEGKQGFFALASEKNQALLVKSQQKKFPVKVQVNSSSRQILSVESASEN